MDPKHRRMVFRDLAEENGFLDLVTQSYYIIVGDGLCNQYLIRGPEMDMQHRYDKWLEFKVGLQSNANTYSGEDWFNNWVRDHDTWLQGRNTLETQEFIEILVEEGFEIVAFKEVDVVT